MFDPVVGKISMVISTVRAKCGIDVGLTLRTGEDESNHECMMYGLSKWIERASTANGQCFVLIMLTVMKIRYIMRLATVIRDNGMKCENQDLAKQILGLKFSFLTNQSRWIVK
jgi:hypothetical protein